MGVPCCLSSGPQGLIDVVSLSRQEEERRRREEEMIHKREVEEQMRRQREEKYRGIGNFMESVSQIHTLQSHDYHGYLKGKRRQNGDEQRPARGITALQISNTTINKLFRPSVTKC